MASRTPRISERKTKTQSMRSNTEKDRSIGKKEKNEKKKKENYIELCCGPSLGLVIPFVRQEIWKLDLLKSLSYVCARHPRRDERLTANEEK